MTSDFPLVPESILKKRHDLDDLVRKRAAANMNNAAAALRQQQGRRKAGKQQLQHSQQGVGMGTGNATKVSSVYVKKPETILASARSRRNHLKRFRRVLRKGMQKRASDQPEFTITRYTNPTTRVQEPMSIIDCDDDKDSDAAAVAVATTTETTQDKGGVIVVKKVQTNSVGARMVLVIRIRNNNVGAPTLVIRTLQQLRLHQPHTGIFLEYTAAHRQLLHLVEPWVVYGPPSPSVVQDLIERRGHGRRGKQRPSTTTTPTPGDTVDTHSESEKEERIPLSDNTFIEQALGDVCNGQVVCKEDLVHELCHVGEHFATVSAWLWPFLLQDSKTMFERRTLKLKDGGKQEYGDRGERISDYILQVL